jgi:hypothetical protein
MKILTAQKTCLPFCVFFFSLFISSSSSAQWTMRARGVKPRSELTAVEYSGKIYGFFGFRDSLLREVEPSVEVYDPGEDTWTLLDSVPAAKAATHARIAVIDDMVWHIGGRLGKHPGPLTNQIWIYHINANKWTAGPAITDPATGNALLWAAMGTAFLGRTLHIFGGFVSNACNNDQSSYHLTLNVDEWLADTSKPARWKNVSAPLPYKRNHLSTVVLGGKIYAIGGQFGHDCGGGQDQRYSHVYDPVKNTWTALPLLPTPSSHTEGSAFAIDGKIYIAGGQAASGTNSNKVTVFDPAANNGAGAWTENAGLTLPYYYETLSARIIGNSFIISHGGQPRYNNPRAGTYSKTLSRNPVYKLGFLPACTSVQATTGQLLTAKALLFTIDSSKTYVTTSNVPWLTVTKNAVGTAIQNAVDVEVTVNATALAPGNYYGVVTATGTGEGPAYSAAQYCVNLTVLAPSSYTLEAENAFLKGAVVSKNHTGYSGTGFADYTSNIGDYVEWTVNKPASGATLLTFRYANGTSSNKPLKLTVNGTVVASSLPFLPSGSWSKWSNTSFTTNLVQGVNKIRLTSIASVNANIDRLVWANAANTKTVASTQKEEIVPAGAESPNGKVSVTPNPASGMARVTWPPTSGAAVDVLVVDGTGRIQKSFAVKNGKAGQLTFPVQSLPAGLYVVVVRQGTDQHAVKLLVNK